MPLVAHQGGERRRRGQCSGVPRLSRPRPGVLPMRDVSACCASDKERSICYHHPMAQGPLKIPEEKSKSRNASYNITFSFLQAPTTKPQTVSSYIPSAKCIILRFPSLKGHNHAQASFFPAPPNHLTLLFLISCKRANIFPVFARLDPHLIKLAHYVAL